MATQPSSVPSWCIDDQDANNKDLKIEPPASFIQTGLLARQPWPRVWHNFYLNNHSQFLQFINDEILGVGTVLSYSDGNAPDFVNDFEGTWTNIGSQVIGAVTVQYYERTA